MFNRPDINVKKSPRDQAERIYWIARTIDVSCGKERTL